MKIIKIIIIIRLQAFDSCTHVKIHNILDNVRSDLAGLLEFHVTRSAGQIVPKKQQQQRKVE